MFTFAGSFTTGKGQMDGLNIDPDWRHIRNEGDDKVLHYIAGITDIANSTKLLNYVAGNIHTLISCDISHTGDPDADIVELRAPKKTGGTYYYIAYHGQQFDQVASDSDNVLSIRTAENSKHLGGKVIKIDMIQ